MKYPSEKFKTILLVISSSFILCLIMIEPLDQNYEEPQMAPLQQVETQESDTIYYQTESIRFKQ